MNMPHTGQAIRPGTTLLVFTLNEIDGMKAVMPLIPREWIDEVLIVDGGSTDGTVEWALTTGHNLFRQSRPGFGDAFLEGVARARHEIVICFSPDGNSKPEAIPPLVTKIMEGHDIVIASRYLDGAKSEDDDILSAPGNRTFTWLVNTLFQARITDSLVMYRAYRRHLIRELGVNTSTVSWGTQILLRALRAGKKIAEIPADEPRRIGGTRKMQPLKNTCYELAMLFREYFRREAKA
jgi:glycosyltransferase involved in cell wall biosynthesis